MSSPTESSCCFTFPLSSHLPTRVTALLYCPSCCFSASSPWVCECACVCMCVSHAHCHTPDLYNAPNALDTRLLGKVAWECWLTAFKSHFHLYTHSRTHIVCLCSNYIFMLVKLSKRQSGGTSVSLAGGGRLVSTPRGSEKIDT